MSGYPCRCTLLPRQSPWDRAGRWAPARVADQATQTAGSSPAEMLLRAKKEVADAQQRLEDAQQALKEARAAEAMRRRFWNMPLP
jgi:hypothetical protein